MKKLDLSRTYVDFLLDKGEGYNLETIFDGEKNSKLLKELSTSMVENDISIKEVLDILDKHNVSLPNTSLLNESHEEKIFHLGLSLYSSLFIQGKLKELAQKESHLEGLLEGVEKTNSLDEADKLKTEIEDNKERMRALRIIGVDRFASLLNNPKYIESFLSEDTQGMIVALAKSAKEKEAAKKIIDTIPEQKGSVENFVSEIRALIDKVDIFINRCQTLIDSHDVSAKIENEGLNDSLSKTEDSNTQKQGSTKKVAEAPLEKVHFEARNYVAADDNEGMDAYEQRIPEIASELENSPASSQKIDTQQEALKEVEESISGKQNVPDINTAADAEAFEVEKFKVLTSESNQKAREGKKSIEVENITPKP